jgi:RNA polymerase sigma-70 factor (ECF subfamily)
MSEQPDAPRRARFERVAAEVWQPLQRYVRRRADATDADDIVADALLVLWRRLDDVPVGAELPWAYQAARRCLANHRRSDRRRAGLVERLWSRRSDEPAADPAAEADGDDALTTAMAKLSIDDRELLHLWAWDELEPREIAEVVGASANAVGVRLHRARRRLADALDDLARTQTAPTSTGHVVTGRTGKDRGLAGQEVVVITMEQQP